jgi:hypothetical protein
MTKLAQLIGKEEGWGIPGKIPTRRNNPGDLTHSNHSSHEGIGHDDVGIIDTVEHGWEDLEGQLVKDEYRGMTLEQLIYAWAPAPANDPAQYLANVLSGFHGAVQPNTPLSKVLEIQA